jgi:glycosyltransferase involved in cell wall biosynthesis
MIDVSIVLPVYNEVEGIEKAYLEISKILKDCAVSYEIVFVNDGSKDGSDNILTQIYQEDPDHVMVVHFARNFGHQLAITAGLNHCRGKVAIVMDSDLQDPPELIKEFIAKWKEGYQIVYGQRSQREGESFFKKITAKIFYRIMQAYTNFDVPENVGDFYLLDRKIIDILNLCKERHRFIRGLVAWVGFKRCGIQYVRRPRIAGHTKFPFFKMLKFSLDGITSFSSAPLRIVSLIGALCSLGSFVTIFYIFYLRYLTDATITGWSSIMVVILFIGGLQLLAIGLIGEYIARIGDDVKQRPLYAVQNILKSKETIC